LILGKFGAQIDILSTHNHLHCVRGQEGTPLPKFWAVGKLSENFVLVGKLLSNSATFGAEKLILENVRGKIEIYSTHNLLCLTVGSKALTALSYGIFWALIKHI